MKRRGAGAVGGAVAGTAVAAVLAAVVAAVLAWTAMSAETGQPLQGPPPPADGYFRSLPAGAWQDLPSEQTCAAEVHRSPWEPRPDNTVPNHTMPDVGAVHTALATRPRNTGNGYDPRWDGWLLPRVTGHHTGTTDENIQWAACKWGLSDDLLRAIAYRESNWFQHEVYGDGLCVPRHGCGDDIGPGATVATYCAGLAAAGEAGDPDDVPGACPGTFSIVGVKSWQAPSWGPMPGDQNGTFPFNRDSTAFALDYLGAFLRGCDEGWMHWLGNRSGNYAAGDLWGCVGVWYAGAWQTPAAQHYEALVRSAAATRPWLSQAWARQRPACSQQHGCPAGLPQTPGPTTSR